VRNGFIKVYRGGGIDEMLRRPIALALLLQIALRARWRPGMGVNGLQPGQALIGDYATLGITERRYRTAKNWLKSAGLATFQATNKGTIATLLNSDIFDINTDGGDEQNDRQPTGKRRTSDEQKTTNEEGKKGKNNKERMKRPELSEVCSFCLEIGLPGSDGDYCFHKWQSNDWTNGGKPIRDWKATIRAWKAAGYLPSQKGIPSAAPAVQAYYPQASALFPEDKP